MRPLRVDGEDKPIRRVCAVVVVDGASRLADPLRVAGLSGAGVAEAAFVTGRRGAGIPAELREVLTLVARGGVNAAAPKVLGEVHASQVDGDVAADPVGTPLVSRRAERIDVGGGGFGLLMSGLTHETPPRRSRRGCETGHSGQRFLRRMLARGRVGG